MYNKRSSRKIYCTTNGERYPSIKEAARMLNLHVDGIKRMLRGNQKTVKGYEFRYIEPTLFEGVCAINNDECTKGKFKGLIRGFCRVHYERFLEHGDPNYVERIARIKVRCIETGKVYPSCQAASIAIGANPKGVAKVIRGKGKSIKGLTFERVK